MSLKRIVMVSLLLHVSVVDAFTLNGSISNGRVSWDNIIFSHGQQTLSTWSTVSGLAPTTKWRPGFMASPQVMQAVVLSSGAHKVSLPLVFTGMEYNTGSNSIADVISNPTSRSCDTSIATGNVIHLVGEWDCSYENLVKNGSLNIPFFFLRPLINIDNNAVLHSFEGKPEGRYVGGIPITIRYFYYTTSGALTYRDIKKTFSVQIGYKPSYVSSLTITGSGVIEPIYDKAAKSVSGTTSIDINATGYFDKGLKIMLQTRDYKLSTPSSSSTISYDIDCRGFACSSNLVKNGSISVSDLVLKSDSNNSSINFTLDISYKDISAVNIDSGRYTDSFNVVFETDF